MTVTCPCGGGLVTREHNASSNRTSTTTVDCDRCGNRFVLQTTLRLTGKAHPSPVVNGRTTSPSRAPENRRDQDSRRR